MAYPLHLSGAEKKAYLKGLRDKHSVETSVVILDRNEDPRGERIENIIDGSVEIDTATSPTRRLSVQVLDRSNRFAVDTGSPSRAALAADRFIRAFYTVKIPGQSEIDVPIFTGPTI